MTTIKSVKELYKRERSKKIRRRAEKKKVDLPDEQQRINDFGGAWNDAVRRVQGYEDE